MISLGIYRHYKGALYNVTGVAQNSTNGEDDEIYVIYHGLEMEPGHAGIRTRLRAYQQFHSLVHREDGSQCAEVCSGHPDICDDTVQRFTYLGSSLTNEMIEHRLAERDD